MKFEDIQVDKLYRVIKDDRYYLCCGLDGGEPFAKKGTIVMVNRKDTLGAMLSNYPEPDPDKHFADSEAGKFSLYFLNVQDFLEELE